MRNDAFEKFHDRVVSSIPQGKARLPMAVLFSCIDNEHSILQLAGVYCKYFPKRPRIPSKLLHHS